ncbi:hypothetical protein EJB05_41749 [Eragrostis curvula]|uniref:J domain-containing protein n=1 Tax=Eragrostis curvula TaxID=38414 RepID=A0A5J9TAS8_9POAL|nr:hypothetical protein EJB05_41749 [Eragrostis curvula]
MTLCARGHQPNPTAESASASSSSPTTRILVFFVMAVGGGVRVLMPPQASTSSSVAAWGRWRTGTVRRSSSRTIRCSCMGMGGVGTWAFGGLAEEHYRTLRLLPGASRGEVKKAFRRLALMYHPDVCKQSGDGDSGVHFQRINVAYQMLMSNMREAEERLDYWRIRYGLSDEDLDKYRCYVNDKEDDEWLDL